MWEIEREGEGSKERSEVQVERYIKEIRVRLKQLKADGKQANEETSKL